VITIYPGDSVIWENADTAFHTITSVTQSGEENGLFDSGFFTAGDSYTREFTELGDFFLLLQSSSLDEWCSSCSKESR
jgi:plastocyanin